MIITIDGPAGSGKSSVAKALAKKLGASHLNSGLLFRAAAYLFFKEKSFDQTSRAAALSLGPEELSFMDEIVLTPVDGSFSININGQVMTKTLAGQAFDAPSAAISPNQNVRQRVLELQRKAAKLSDLVIDGRDCGIKVFPNADLKVFLTASPNARAKRVAQRNFGGQVSSGQLEKIEQSIIERDHQDTTRKTSPLAPAPDAFVLDNSDLNFDQTLAVILQKLDR